MSNRNRYAGFRKEAVYGVEETNPPIRYEDCLCSIQPNPNWIIPEPVSKRAYQKRARGLIRSQGTLGDFDVTPEGIIGDLLLGVFGDVNVTNPEANVYLHEFVPADSIPSYTVRVGVEQTEREIIGSLVESLTLKFAYGQFVKANALIYSGFPETKASIGTPTIDTPSTLYGGRYPRKL